MTTLGTGTVEYRIGDGACIDTGSSVGTGSQTIDVGVWSEGSYEIYALIGGIFFRRSFRRTIRRR